MWLCFQPRKDAFQNLHITHPDVTNMSLRLIAQSVTLSEISPRVSVTWWMKATAQDDNKKFQSSSETKKKKIIDEPYVCVAAVLHRLRRLPLFYHKCFFVFGPPFSQDAPVQEFVECTFLKSCCLLVSNVHSVNPN